MAICVCMYIKYIYNFDIHIETLWVNKMGFDQITLAFPH